MVRGEVVEGGEVACLVDLDVDTGLDGMKGQRDINLVDICLLGREVELSETLVFHIFE